ncbi:hypothetical protein [Bizionia arctica]|uniref:Uncharacterized protein n=1 Tax=Bizionia arctica TaxID=1495645 RepID=A0A917GKC4_9FLAO|nr:hypothetical protein [Bizionia arctica]GGG49390.1 hypothetical protein GCM10010976_20870 [Bizionia arctica]
MEKLIALINEIQDCTLEIEVHYPTLYNQLDKNPYEEQLSKVSTEMLLEYFNALKVKLDMYQIPICHESSAVI